LNCTLATPTLAVTVNVTLIVPDTVAPAIGEVIDTIGGVVEPVVAKVTSPLAAELPLASADFTRK
jgi:hypothetical protein